MAILSGGDGGGGDFRGIPGFSTPLGAGEGLYYDTVGKRKAQRKRPPVAPIADTGATPTFDEGALAQRLAARQQQVANAQQAAELDMLINRLRAEETSDLADFDARLAAIPGRTAQLEAGARQGALRSGAVGRRGLAGRGLSLSGIRAGFEGRNEANLLAGLGRIGQGAAQESDAIRRAIERLRGETERQVSEAQTRKLAFLQ